MPQMMNVILILDREDNFNTMIEITGHQVCAAEINIFLAVIMKIKQAAVFKVTPNNADDTNIFADAFYARPQAAHTAHEQINLHARL